jgi:hypoxanthine phosphoribosyltransferase
MIAMKDPRNDEKNLWVGWDEYHRLIELLALSVHESGWKFDQILCLARGGLRVGDQLSRIYDLPLAILATSSYREAAGTEQGELDIAQYITMTRGELHGNVLLVDDLVDSGVTLARVQQHLKERYPAITAVRSAVLWYKGCSKVKPDYHVQYLPTNPWIHQPFEEWDTVRPHNLGAGSSAVSRSRRSRRESDVNFGVTCVSACIAPYSLQYPQEGARLGSFFLPVAVGCARRCGNRVMRISPAAPVRQTP